MSALYYVGVWVERTLSPVVIVVKVEEKKYIVLSKKSKVEILPSIIFTGAHVIEFCNIFEYIRLLEGIIKLKK